MKMCFKPKNFSKGSMLIIDKAVEICRDYAQQGYDLTLRQLYYQFVSRDIIANKDTEYDRLGSIINDARLAGLVDWKYITDRTRNLASLSHWDEPQDIMRSAASGYRTDKWSDQDYRVEIWVEKEALAGIVAGAADPLDVPYFSCRGYVSQSEMFDAGRRMREYVDDGQKPVIIHLGDHDPSGIDMSRDIEARIKMFMGSEHRAKPVRSGYDDEDDYENDLEEWEAMRQEDEEENEGRDPVLFKRIALNMPQIRQYEPPPNPAKLTDSRCRDYMAKFGNSSWELDALEPRILTNLIQTEILKFRDQARWDAAEAKETAERADIRRVSDRWSEVQENLR